MNRLYAAAALIAIVVGLWLYHSGVVKERDAARLELGIKTQALEARNELIKKQNTALVEANVRASQHLEANKVITDEKAKLDKCIADKSCGFSVRYKPAKVPTPTDLHTEPGKSPAYDQTCQYGEAFQRGVSALWESIQRDAKQIEGLQAELMARSQPDYCKVGKQ